MDGYRVRLLLIVAAAIAVGASLWFLPRAASFITPSPPAPIELRAAPTPTGDRATTGGAPTERVEEPAPGDDADDRGSSGGAAAGDEDDDDDRGAGSGSSATGDDDDDDDTGNGDDDDGADDDDGDDGDDDD
jgi:hypothetical protein